jgi:hypothetical protein
MWVVVEVSEFVAGFVDCFSVQLDLASVGVRHIRVQSVVVLDARYKRGYKRG